MSGERLTTPSVRNNSAAVSAAELIAAADQAVGGALSAVDIPANRGATANWPDWVDPTLVTALQHRGIKQPWQHQIAAADLAHAGRNVVIATGTASGKSLAY